MRRRRRNAKMAERVEDLFHDGMQFSLEKLGYPNLELKKEQYDVLERNAWTKICAECYQLYRCIPIFNKRSVSNNFIPFGSRSVAHN